MINKQRLVNTPNSKSISQKSAVESQTSLPLSQNTNTNPPASPKKKPTYNIPRKQPTNSKNSHLTDSSTSIDNDFANLNLSNGGDTYQSQTQGQTDNLSSPHRPDSVNVSSLRTNQLQYEFPKRPMSEVNLSKSNLTYSFSSLNQNPQNNYIPSQSASNDFEYSSAPQPPVHRVPLKTSRENHDSRFSGFKHTIEQSELRELLQECPENVLLIDIRFRNEFNNGHLPSSNVVCFEPVGIRSTEFMSDDKLEDALVIAPDHEQHLFEKRNTFPLVVYYDNDTSNADFLTGSFGSDHDKKLSLFVDYIYHRATTKKLRQHPCLLVGGIEGWIDRYGKESTWKSADLPLELPSSTNFTARLRMPELPVMPSINGTSQNYDRNSTLGYDYNNNTIHENIRTDSFDNDPASGSSIRVVDSSQNTFWNSKYITDKTQIFAPQPPKEIPSRPYGSRKGSVASTNKRLSFDGSAAYNPVPDYLNNNDPTVNNINSYPYARSPTDLMTMPAKQMVPQSLQTPYDPNARSHRNGEMYTFSNRQSNGHYNTNNNPRNTHNTTHGLPQLPPPVAHVPQSQSQYPHSEINSGYAMGQAVNYNNNNRNMPSPYSGLLNPNGVPMSNAIRTTTKSGFQLELMRSFTTGLRNLGNTCYMNCIIQCLAATEKFAPMFMNGLYMVNLKSKMGYKGALASSFAHLLQEMVRKNRSFVSPDHFRALCGSLSETFRGYEQQDCHEFLNFLLDGLHEELNAAGNKTPLKPLTEEQERMQERLSLRVASANEWSRYSYSNNSPVTSRIQGQYLSRLQCTVCNFTSTTFNAFSCLSLPIPQHRNPVDLKECFQLFTQQEILDGDNAWNCPNCKTRRRTIKTMRISRLPYTLIVHLKRFRQTSRGTSDKLEVMVTYPLQGLDLTEFWVRPTGPEDNKAQQGGQHPPFIYNLFAVATHTGSLKGGHYTSFVKKSGPNGWCYFDDYKYYTQVKPAHVQTENAYVLFFERIPPVQ